MDSKVARWTGLGLTTAVTLFLLADGLTGLLKPQSMAAEMNATGWPLWTASVIGGLALVSALIYAIPRSSVLGAILITGFLGGAIATHLRVGEIGSPPQLICIALGIATWGGLWLRDPRARAFAR